MSDAAQVEAVKRMMSPVVNSKGQVIYAYPDILGTATEWAAWHYPARQSRRAALTPISSYTTSS